MLKWLQSKESNPNLPPNVDCSQVFLSRDTASGNIVHYVALWAIEKDLGQVKLKGVVVIQGFFNEKRIAAELCLKNVPIVSMESLD